MIVPEQYKSNNQCTEFVNFIAVIIKEVAKITNSKFCSLLIDGSSDKFI